MLPCLRPLFHWLLLLVSYFCWSKAVQASLHLSKTQSSKVNYIGYILWKSCSEIVSWCEIASISSSRAKLQQCAHGVKRASCYRSANKLWQGCCKTDVIMGSHCFFPIVVTSLKQVVITLLQGRWPDDRTCKLFQVATSLLSSICNNLLCVDSISDLLEQLVVSLLSSSTLLLDDSNLVSYLSTTGNKQCEHILLTKLWDFYACSWTH
jgi:hypothetical protein